MVELKCGKLILILHHLLPLKLLPLKLPFDLPK